MPEPVLSFLGKHLSDNRRLLVWSLVIAFLLWLVIAVKEVTVLLFASYFLSLLLDPLVDRFETWGVRRGLAIFTVLFALTFAIVGFIAILVPTLIAEYQHFSKVLPGYLDQGAESLKVFIHNITGSSVSLDPAALLARGKELFSGLGAEQIGLVASQLGDTVLKGYSFTLTVINLTLLPFFVYYITKDLDLIHSFIGSVLPTETRAKVSEVGSEILGHLHAFFKGQLTVSATMAVLYIIGLSIIGLPSALVVGVIAGFLNIVPYLGIAIGLVLALILTLVTTPDWWSIVQVFMVFGFVQFCEGVLLTPKIVGESVGIHPLGVILALIIGGQLFGLAGMVLAIPGAAALRVLFNHSMSSIEKSRIVEA